ncbi:hypothetical protein GLOTRDRAFT_132961 [Gloeophyllum trabeum ATCC 11539]|uniref:LigT-like protein n=1 Tax=Gloeophyllum trabeum (strain ATCC 11539 / FP-39264 / Madison 617) TaxID=670483 RepID=S7PW97_GLOTA|nr:uncharacterized protein GLOTRDRAFT_132961 [Gloeophyllum trabeum ATCC 11539]EPQ51592.1 hypothetical protein GLOTRDRAFT_132961 [Gloeophyllum trabeum ATCC 11539]
MEPLLNWIHKVRRGHDRHIDRWPMPHITLLYPFVHPRENADVYDTVRERVREACASFSGASGQLSFGAGQDAFGYFAHSRKSATVYLKPQAAHSWLGRLLAHVLASSQELRDYDEQAREGGRLPAPRAVTCTAGGYLHRGRLPAPRALAVEEHFTPHLSLGQWPGKGAAEKAVASLAESFPGPVAWQVKDLCLLQRDGFRDPFRVAQRIPIGGAAGC